MRELESVVRRAFPRARIAGAARLGGGVSAAATLFELEHGAEGEPSRVVVRRPGAEGDGPSATGAARELRVLAAMHAAGVPAPEPLFLDEQAGALVLRYLPGQPDFAPRDVERAMHALAETLAAIHRVGPGSVPLEPRNTSAGELIAREPDVLDEALGEARLRAVLRSLWPWPQRNEDVILHGDYWPGNVLWHEGQISGVIDWEEAELGDPLADVALARLDLLWAFGLEAVAAFTRYYRSLTALDWTYLPHWELCIALRPMSQLPRWASSYSVPPISRPDIDATSMADGHRAFVKRALEDLGAR